MCRWNKTLYIRWFTYIQRRPISQTCQTVYRFYYQLNYHIVLFSFFLSLFPFCLLLDLCAWINTVATITVVDHRDNKIRIKYYSEYVPCFEAIEGNNVEKCSTIQNKRESIDRENEPQRTNTVFWFINYELFMRRIRLSWSVWHIIVYCQQIWTMKI